MSERHLTALVAALACAGCLSSPPDTSGPGPDGDGGASGGDLDDACGGLSSLHDEFEGGLSDWRWSPQGEWGAELDQIQLMPSADSVAALHSVQTWRVEGDLVVELDTELMDEDALLELWLWEPDHERNVSLVLEGGALHARVLQPSFNGTRASVAFDPAMRWWRLGRADGRFHWATSSDGIEWTAHEDFDAELSGLAGVSVVHQATVAPSQVVIEAINPGGAGDPACPVSSFSDDFSAASSRWVVFGDPACSVDFRERAEISFSGDGVCGLASNERFSIEDSHVTVELADAGDCALNPAFELAFDGGVFSFNCRLDGEAGRLYAYYSSGEVGGEVGWAPWSAAEQRFLRIRHDPPDQVVFEISPDGVDWDGFGTASQLGGADLSSVEVGLLASTETAVGVVAFDQLNITSDGE